MANGGKEKLFIDASVLVAATFSDTGASFFIFRLAEKGLVDITITEEIVRESRSSLARNYEQKIVFSMIKMLSRHKKSIKPDIDNYPSYKELIEDKKDLHVLAGAKEYEADFLITLDRKHFMTEKLAKANLPFEIILPGDYLKILRKKIDV